jgi:RNA recognition motif-containing protein
MGTRIFVGNLPFSATEDQLRQLFAPHGEVSSVSIVKDKFTDRSRGFAFVEMATAESANAAITALAGHSMDNRQLTINVARERTEGGSRGGFGGGRSGGRSGGGGFSGGNRW